MITATDGQIARRISVIGGIASNADADTALAVPPLMGLHSDAGHLGIAFADHPFGDPILIPPVLLHVMYCWFGLRCMLCLSYHIYNNEEIK